MLSGFLSGDILRGLTIRILFFLSLALLPIGLIAISQTQEIIKQNRLNAELSLLAVTEQAATAETRILQEAFGAAHALSSIVTLFWNNPEGCSAFFRTYEAENESYSLVGFIQSDGLMICSSSESPFDFSGSAELREAIADPRPRTRSLRSAALTERPATVVTTPVFVAGELDGFIVISIPFEAFEEVEEPDLPMLPLALMTFNKQGDILVTERGIEQVGGELPSDVALAVFTEDEPTVFEARNQNGVTRVYAVRPIVRDAVFAVSVWPRDSPFFDQPLLTRLSALLPITMWAASLLVAFWALNRLVIRHIGKLGRQMRRFALNRDLPRNTLGPSVPLELVEIENTFIRMGESILQDEATLEDSLREKNILLKEVHHRVKNNLQLISSIMNMQIRQATTQDAKRVLSRLQERILGLATVHKNLYQTDDLARVDAATLLREVVNQLLAVGLAAGSNVTVEQDYAQISLETDDAAPLTLLVSEAVTNALKHVVQDGRNAGRISVRLEREGQADAILTISNTKGAEPSEAGTGLGFKLINAFARQLNGNFTVDDDGDTYELKVAFPIAQEDRPRNDF